MIFAGVRILEFLNRLLQRRFLLRAAFQFKIHVLHGETICHRPPIVLRSRERVGVAG